MTTEMGESLIHSWLKHVQGCHVVQTNWKAAKSWTLRNQEEIVGIVERAVTELKIFPNKRNCRIEALTKRVLKQFECDCVGLKLLDDCVEAIGVDVAFHTAGLHYTPSKTSSYDNARKYTAHKIIEKLFAVAIAIWGYLGIKRARIYFAAPKIGPTQLTDVQRSLNKLRSFWSNTATGLDYEFDVIHDDGFQKNVLKAVLDKIEDVADTSECFLRCIQLEQMFEDIDVDGADVDKDGDMEDSSFDYAHKYNLRKAKKILGSNKSCPTTIEELYVSCKRLISSGWDKAGWLSLSLREEFRRRKNLEDRPTMRSMAKELKK